MRVKNIGTNPVHGIKPGETGELPKNRESRIGQYVKYGMLEKVEEPKKATEKATEPKKPEVEKSSEKVEEPKKPGRGRPKAEDK